MVSWIVHLNIMLNHIQAFLLHSVQNQDNDDNAGDADDAADNADNVGNAYNALVMLTLLPLLMVCACKYYTKRTTMLSPLRMMI